MEGRSFKRLIYQTHSRTGLVGAYNAVIEIEPRAEVDRDLLERAPFVLNVDAVEPGGYRPVVNDGEGEVVV